MATLSFRSFPKIGKWQDALNSGNELFHHANVEKSTKQRIAIDPMSGMPMPLQPENRLYSAKVKLHGTNAGIQTDGKGNFVTQSRGKLLSSQTKTSDNMGFCAWVEKNLSKGWDLITKHVVLFGEYVGPGINTGDACSKLPERMLFVFAVYDVEEDIYIFLPEDIEKYVRPIVAANAGAEKIVHVIPEISVLSNGAAFCENFFFDIDPSTANDKHPQPHPQILADWTTKTAKIMTEIVLPMEQQDPYIMSKFGVDGLGEGIVMYANTWNGREYRNLMFKMKTPHHVEELSTEKVEKITAKTADPCAVFAKRFVVHARCDKVCAAATQHNPENMGLFLDALVNDVRSETVTELMEKGGWSEVYEAAVRVAAADWWAQSRKKKTEMQNSAENKLADELIVTNEALLTQVNDMGLEVDAFATEASKRLVPDEKDLQLRKKVCKRAKTWWTARNKQSN